MINKANSTTAVHHNKVVATRKGWVAPGMMTDRLVVDKELYGRFNESNYWNWDIHAPGAVREAGNGEIGLVYQCADGTRVGIPSGATMGCAHYRFTDAHGGVVGWWEADLLVETHVWRYHGEAKVFEVAA